MTDACLPDGRRLLLASTSPYRRALLERLRLGYVPYMLNKLDYYEAQSQALLGYALPQVLLIYVIVKFRDRGDGRKAATFIAAAVDEFFARRGVKRIV